MAKLSRKGLSETFEIEGRWWIPGLNQFKCFGTLVFKLGSISLNIKGSLTGRRKQNQKRDCKIIHGKSLEGESVSLIEAVLIERSNDYLSSKWFGSRFILGKHLTDVNLEEYLALSIMATGLEFTATPRQLFGTIRVDKSQKTSVTATWYKPPESNFELYDVESQEHWKLGLNYICVDEGNLHSASIRHLATIHLIPKKVKSISWMQNKAKQIQNILSLLNGFSTPLQTVALHDHTIKANWLYYHHEASFENNDESILPLPIIPIHQLTEDQFQKFLNTYFSLPPQAEETVKFFVSILHRNATYFRTEFIELTQVLESYDRNRENQAFYMPPQQYLAEIYPEIEKSIPSNLEKDFREKLKGSLRWGYEYSLRTRLKKIAKRLPPALKEMLCSNTKNFSSKISSTRNSLTHNSSIKNSESMSDFEISFAIPGLKLLILSLILMDMEIPPDLIKKGIEKCWDYRMFSARSPW